MSTGQWHKNGKSKAHLIVITTPRALYTACGRTLPLNAEQAPDAPRCQTCQKAAAPWMQHNTKHPKTKGALS